MKIVLSLILAFSLCGCATLSLRKHIEHSAELSETRIQVGNLDNGVAKLTFKYIGMETHYTNKQLVYEGKIDDEKIYIKFPTSTEYERVVISDSHKVSPMLDDGGSLSVFLSKDKIKNIQICDLASIDSIAFIQLRELRTFSDGQKRSRYDYDTLSGQAFYIYNGLMYTREVQQRLSLETSVKIASGIKSLGYLVTLPLDVITSPVQGIVFLFAYIHAMGGMSGPG